MQRRIERLLDRAEDAVDRGDWAEVRSLCDRVLRLDPGNTDALELLDAAQRDTSVQLGASSIDDSDREAPQRRPAGSPTSFAGGRYAVRELQVLAKKESLKA